MLWICNVKIFLLCPKIRKSSSREAFSPHGEAKGAAAASACGTKKMSRKTSRVETWLQGVAPTCPTQECSPTIDAENTQSAESDCEIVSVSQIHPNETSGSSKKKPLSACIEEDGEVDERNTKTVNVKPKAITKRSSNKSKATIKSNTSFDSSGKNPELKIPDPVVVLIDREKENTSNPLPQRSPGWSRVNKMKKDFNPPKVLRTVNAKGNNSSMPTIEDGGSGDDQPCFSLSLDSPMVKRRAKMREIVNNLESEIKICEESFLRAENVERKLKPQHSSSTAANRPKQGTVVPSNQSRVRFYKLGSFIARKQRRVPIYLKGPLEHSDSFDVSSLHYRLHVDAQTQTTSESDSMLQVMMPKHTDQKSTPLNTFLSPPKLPKSQHRRSSEFDVDMMDAETVVFSQPLRHPNIVIPETLSYDRISEPGEPMDMESPSKRVKPLSQISKPDSFHKEKDPSWLSQESVSVVCSPTSGMSPRKVSDFESLSVINPTVDLNDSFSSVVDVNKSKRSRTLAASSESSDSEVGVSRKQFKKKKKTKKHVLSDNEDSFSNQLDISTVDTEKIMANIEAELEDSEKTEFCNLNKNGPNKSLVHLQQTFNDAKSFNENLEVLSDVSITQNDSDADSELINPTPQKQTSFSSRTITHSDDVVPSSQPSGENLPPPPVSFLQASKDLTVKDSSCIPPATPREQEQNYVRQNAHPAADRENVVVHSMKSNTVDPPPVIPSALKPVFVCSSITGNLTSQVEKLALMVGGEFSPKFSGSTTHLIVRVEEGNRADKTLKYLSAVACGKWVVSFSWVQKCLEAKKLIPEEPFEALDTTGEPGPRRSRQARQSGQKLFKGFEFCCIGDFVDLTKSQLEELLIECGGSVVPKPTEFSFQDGVVPICLAQWDEEKEQEYSSWLDNYSSPLIQHEWVLDCIGKFLVTSFAPMLLCDVTDDVLSSMGIPPHLFEYIETDQ
ncbi:Breast cancer type 1 susceptibility protein-like protein [Frankliniella fusca]|uniref:Breast cancer type 1 susceptibility protein-like protein n=1 Tax=Frankliniella fusca TaxID=407009 RepID=A0AAE1I0W2_9NEOP|nr:Breast cancer type 1 susceptibility protein-like protein [Frankliniella fusca]